MARFSSEKEAARVAADINKFLHAHAKEKDQHDDWEAPTAAMAEIEKRWGFKFGKGTYLYWGDGGLEGDEPEVGVTGVDAVFAHTYCGGLDFISTMVKAQGGKVVDESDGDITVSVMLKLKEGAAGKKLAKELATFFGQTQPSFDDWKPGPWVKKSNRRSEMPYAEVNEEVRYWTDGQHIGFHMPLLAYQLEGLKAYVESAGVETSRITLCDGAFFDKLTNLRRIGRCPECKSNELTLFEADRETAEDQLLCGACGGMFDFATMLAHAPVQSIARDTLGAVDCLGDSLYALSTDGPIYVKTPKAKKWRKTGKKGINVHCFQTADGKDVLAGGTGGLFHSTDGGKKWTKKKVKNERTFSLARGADGTIFAGGGAGWGGGDRGGILMSKNGGKKWESVLETKAIVFGISVASPDVLYACDGTGKVWRSKNGGKSWQGASPAKKPLCRVVARSETHAVAVGDGGTIVMTTDGKKWAEQKSGVQADIEAVVIGNDGRFYAVTSTGELLTSGDGKKWERHPTGTSVHLWGLTATPDGTLVCVGEDGIVVRLEGIDVEATETAPEDEEDLPTVGRTFVFTGKLRHLTRDEATARASKLGGVVKSSVGAGVDYLVVGDEGSPLYGAGKKGAKLVKAEALIAGGAKLQIISEGRFSRLRKLDGGGAKAKAKAKAPAKAKASAKAKAKAPAKAKAKAKAPAQAKGKRATVGKSFVFTGKLASMSRAEAKKRVAELGGSAKSSVTKDLDYLVVGDAGSPLYGAGKKGAKLIKAESLIAGGAGLRVISEADFSKMKRL